LWGRGAFEVDESKGLQLLTAAASRGSANACMTIAGFHDRGEWGFERSTELRDKYRQLAKGYDETTYDEFS
jgi:TPR repeat protein